MIFMIIACWYGGELRVVPQMDPFVFGAESAWINVVPFSRIFSMQGFFMIIYVYLKDKVDSSNRHKDQRVKRVTLFSIAIMVVNAFTYGFCDSAVLYFVPRMEILWDIVFVSMGFLMILIQIPFKFYMTKEFLFILYDEIKNRGLSSKINDLKLYNKGELPHYSRQEVKKLRDDLY